uniref:Protein kinase domain-containing protein n=2 Tax=Dunaliella tertiolecta TaxID=3047 RepID=A0A7S3VIQ8_DUNTE|mmetsp:Transcript_23248/g.64234  ORF Transcript_23248/g.64234 Transcript_23248/m.64234 type:complete len:619 (+) Transcript_23248:38-1894(+)
MDHPQFQLLLKMAQDTLAGNGMQLPLAAPAATHAAPAAAAAVTSGSNKRGRDPSSEEEAPKRVCRPGIPPATSTTAFQVPDRPSPPLRADDKEGHYVYQLGENLSSRYKILSKMGEGTFGRVLECWDRKHKDYVAIKIVRNIDKYRHAAMIELEVLNTLERNDPDGNKNCVALREWFDYRGHVCMVFEKLGPSLFDFMRKNEYRPFPIDLVQEFSKQLIQAVAYLHDLHLVHTDLKPENILLMSLNYCRSSSGSGTSSTSRVVPSSSAIKVIDFGSSTFEEQYHSSIVSTRHYRAPEIIMGMGWSYPCDMWSLGCIIVELLTGDALFQTHENLEHLAMMEQVLGPIPEAMVERSNKAASKCFVENRLHWPDGAPSKKSVKAVKKMSNLRRLILNNGDASAVPHIDSLVDLLSGMLRYEPEQRMTAQEALHHPFLQQRLASSIPPQASQPVPPTSTSGPVPPQAAAAASLAASAANPAATAASATAAANSAAMASATLNSVLAAANARAMAGAAAAPPGTATMTELPPLQLQQHGVPVQGGGGVGAGLPPMSGTAMVPSLQAVVPAANHSLPGLSTVPAYNSMPGASSTTNPVSLPNNRHMLLSAGASQAPYMDGIRWP